VTRRGQFGPAGPVRHAPLAVAPLVASVPAFGVAARSGVLLPLFIGVLLVLPCVALERSWGLSAWADAASGTANAAAAAMAMAVLRFRG